MEKEIITADYNGHKIIADILPAGSTPQVFCMHGAGNSSRKTYDSLRQLLAQNSVSSCALDFFGHGETGGDIKESSLKSRTEQAEAIIEKAKTTNPLTIIAGSMAAYNAIKLTEIYPVSSLVLVAPAIYSKDAYKVPFGEKFTSMIRVSGSWDNTDAWDILSRFNGKIIILAGGKDDVVSPEVTQKIYDSSTQASHREIINFPNAPHKISSDYFREHPEDLEMVVDKIVTLLK